MAMSKLKNIIIVILLATNLFLLALVIPSRREAAVRTQRIRDELRELYAGYGVTLDTELPTGQSPLTPLVMEADTAAQQTAALALLGASAREDADGQRGAYRAESGTCRFTHGGGFAASLSGLRLDGEQLPRAAGQLLSEMGFACDGTPEMERVSAGVYALTATQSILDTPVFSARLTLTCSNGVLTELSGTFLTGQAEPAADAQTGLACADALIAFLASRDSLGWVGSSVVSVRQGYVQTETASATTIRLSPVWRIETDTGAFYIDGATGAVSAAS